MVHLVITNKHISGNYKSLTSAKGQNEAMGLTFLSLIFEREITGEIENHKTEQLLQINVGCFYQFQT